METAKKKQLDKILKGSLSVKRCPKCGGNACVIVPLTFYGRDGAKIACQSCDYETELQPIHTPITDGIRLSIPITFTSIARAVFKAVSIWNKAAAPGGAAE